MRDIAIFKSPFFQLATLLIAISFLNKVLFSLIIPIWHTPDEQAHFAQVAYFAEFDRMPSGPSDLNNEIYTSEVLLGTLRDERGNNNFTYHPEYNIEYTNSYLGLYEKQIIEIPLEDRKEIVGQEAARYPPLYYLITAFFYKLFYSSSLIDRVFASRIVSIVLGVLLVIVSLLISKQLFPKNNLLQMSLVVLVGFHPMLNFVSVGVTSDAMLNLLYALGILLCLFIIKNGLNRIYLIYFTVILLLLYLTKPQFVLFIPTFFLAVALSFINRKNLSKKILTFFLIAGLVMGIIFYFGSKNPDFYEMIQKFYNQDFFPGKSKQAIGIVDFTKMTVYKTLHETVPWYWGVYKWLSVVLPIEVLRIINRLLLIIFIGVGIKLFQILKRKRTIEDLMFIFLILSSITYSLGIFYYDYLKFSSANFSFGLQGRYFFPMVTAHMAIMLIGLVTLIPKKFNKYQNHIVKFFITSMVILFVFSVLFVATKYYDLSSFNKFVTQLSQYRPFYYKGNWIYGWFTIYLIFFLYFILSYLRIRK